MTVWVPSLEQLAGLCGIAVPMLLEVSAEIIVIHSFLWLLLYFSQISCISLRKETGGLLPLPACWNC